MQARGRAQGILHTRPQRWTLGRLLLPKGGAHSGSFWLCGAEIYGSTADVFLGAGGVLKTSLCAVGSLPPSSSPHPGCTIYYGEQLQM